MLAALVHRLVWSSKHPVDNENKPAEARSRGVATKMVLKAPENGVKTSTDEIRDVDVGQVAMCVTHTDIPGQDAADSASFQQIKEDDQKQEDGKVSHVPEHDLHPRTKAGFLHIFGWMGIPMVVIFLLSATWTFILAVIQQIPLQVANWLMDTTDLDEGNFWLLPKAEPELSISSTVLLVLFGIGYLGLVVLMVFPDKLLAPQWNPPKRSEQEHCVKPVVLRAVGEIQGPVNPAATGNSDNEPKVMPIDGRRPSLRGVDDPKRLAYASVQVPSGFSWERFRFEATSPHGLLHQYYNPLLDLPKLIFQTTTLFTYLHNGFPVAVIFIYTCALFINWIISAYRYKRERPDPHFVLSRIFYSFDLFFAVFAPLEVLVYAFYTFHFDRAVFSTRTATLIAGTFDRTARLFADPTQVSLFRFAFHYLQFATAGSLLVKCALNVLSLFKWWRTILHLVEHARSSPTAHDAENMGSFDRNAFAKIQRRKYLQNLLIASLFFCAGTAVFIHSIVAVVSTRHVCKPHVQCKVPSYQWNVGTAHCSCIVFVDRETELKTMAEWENPPDTTENLAALATTGHLRIIQIINRQLPTFPEELRQCHELEQIILIYTKILTLPDWTKEFHHLEYFHIEGDLTTKQLTSIPRDLFVDMSHLLFLHLGSLVKLPYVPDLHHLIHLEYLVLAMLHSITELPSFSNLHNLERLGIFDAIQVYELPSLQGLTVKKLTTFTLASREPMCCNGFITGKCDLTDFSCLNRTASGEPLVQCTTKRIPTADYTRLMSTEGQVCEKGLTYDLKNIKPTYASTDAACGGVKYKQCTLNGQVGMCFPARMQPVSCQVKPAYQTMRRLQIQRRVGDRCDPTIEAWLGCQA